MAVAAVFLDPGERHRPHPEEVAAQFRGLKMDPLFPPSVDSSEWLRSLYVGFRRALVAPLARLTLPDKVDGAWLAKYRKSVGPSDRLKQLAIGARAAGCQADQAFAWLVRIKLARARIPIRFEARMALDPGGQAPHDLTLPPRHHFLSLVAPTSESELRAWASREWAGVQPAAWSKPVSETDIVNCLLRCARVIRDAR